MSLSIGIVGLPNVGKSTLFNALLKRQAALAANYPFATIEPNVGIVDVPDGRLEQLKQVVITETGKEPERIMPATVKFFDIAGLVKGASEGEGLGNQFLAHIREVDLILQVVRAFSDENVIRAGATEPSADIDLINTELMLADIQTIDARIESRKFQNDKPLLGRLKSALEQGTMLSKLELTDEEKEYVKELNLMSIKPMLYVLNVDESELGEAAKTGYLYICAKTEAELAGFSDDEKAEYLKELGVKESGLDKVIQTCYATLGLQNYFTAGPKEVRAWTIKKGTKAPQAAGVIHTDFERGFISAEVVSCSVLVEQGDWKKAKEKGLIRLEGKNYVMQDGDVVEFRFNV